MAIGRSGNIFEIQRGNKSAPVLVLDPKGNLLRSWGKGEYTIPHSIRLDRDGNVWTVDAGSSTIIKYSPSGRRLLAIHVGGQPNNGSPFNGTTDVGFGPDGHIFITDGYGNARVLEYTSVGTKIREWGKPGSGPGEFNLPHSIQVDGRTIYVADRENDRIELFNRSGHYLGQIADLGRVYSIKLIGDAIWASMGPLDRSPGEAGGWIVQLDRRTGKLLGHMDLAEAREGHALDVSPSGEPLITLGDAVLWCRAR